jgi:hypothetical protein
MLFNVHHGAPSIEGYLLDFDRNLKGSIPKAGCFEETPLVMHKPIFRYLPDFRTLQDAVIHQDLCYKRKKSRWALEVAGKSGARLRAYEDRER